VALQKTIPPLLRARGYEVSVAGNAREALDSVERDRPDLIVLDLGLPDLDGIEVCRRVRARSDLPIIILSARGGERDKVAALDEGADDYVTKPFGPEELIARVRVALRRVFGTERAKSGQLTRGDLTIDFDRRRVVVGGVEVRLTPKEFELLALMAQHAGRVLTNRVILKAIWGPHAVDQPEHVRVLMGQLRKKIEPEPARPRYLLTEPWVGYRFALAPDEG
jgi:two-component system KDP operon response regulator KdpE